MAGYGDDAGFAAWLTENGHVLPGGAPAPAILRQRGSAYVDGQYGPRFTGAPTGGYAQERSWPRTGAFAYWPRAGFSAHSSAVPDDVVPTLVIQASYAAALYDAQNPGGLSVAVVAAAQVKREKLDALETEYFAPTGDALANATPILSEVEGLLSPFFLATLPTTLLGIRSLGCG